MRQQFILLGASLLLGACGPLLKPAPALYDLGTLQPSAASSSQPLPLDLRVPAWLDTNGIAYRLLQEDGNRLHVYAQSRWAAPLSELLGQTLARRSGLQERLPVRPAGCVLRVEVDAFEQSYSSVRESHGIFAGRAVLVDRRGMPLASHAFSVRETAAAADAAGGVRALSAAVSQVAASLQVWLAGPAQAPITDHCHLAGGKQ